MTIPISLRRPPAVSVALAVAAVALVAVVTAVLWSILAPEPQLIGPTRWLEALRNFA